MRLTATLLAGLALAGCSPPDGAEVLEALLKSDEPRAYPWTPRPELKAAAEAFAQARLERHDLRLLVFIVEAPPETGTQWFLPGVACDGAPEHIQRIDNQRDELTSAEFDFAALANAHVAASGGAAGCRANISEGPVIQPLGEATSDEFVARWPTLAEVIAATQVK